MSGTGDKPRPADARGAGRPRYALPSDLAGSLRHLDDGQLGRLLRAVTEEARRRGRPTLDERPPPPRSGSGKAPGRVSPGGGQDEGAAASDPAGSGQGHSCGAGGRRQAGDHRPAVPDLARASGATARQADARQALIAAADSALAGECHIRGAACDAHRCVGQSRTPLPPGCGARGGDRGNAGGDPNLCVSCRRRQARRPWSGGYR